MWLQKVQIVVDGKEEMEMEIVWGVDGCDHCCIGFCSSTWSFMPQFMMEL